jgi:hypothetical protein
MISKVQRAVSSTNDERMGKQGKHEILRKCTKGYGQMSESLVTRLPGIGQKPNNLCP